jgi:hypothetical protein
MKNAPFTIAVMVSNSFLAIFGQSTSAPQFEVASVRLHASNEPTRIGVRISGNRVSGIASLKQSIPTAYDLQPYQVVGDWVDLDRYELAGVSIDFLLSAQRDAAAAKRFFQKALRSPNHPTPRVINVDKNPSYPPVVEALRAEGTLRRRCRPRPVQPQ